jgi:carbonyl reductase 1
MRVNYRATLNVSNALFPLLRPHARVVNVASMLGMLKFIADKKMTERLLSHDLSVQEIDTFVQRYEE